MNRQSVKKYHDLSDNYVLFMAMLIVIIVVLAGLNKSEKPARNSRTLNDTLSEDHYYYQMNLFDSCVLAGAGVECEKFLP